MNKTIGVLASLGVGPAYLHLLKVRGRKTGRVYTTPVNLFELRERTYLVGGRGHTAWSRNAATTGTVTLVRGRTSREYRARPIPDDEKPEILKGYLEEYTNTVARFFSVPAGSPIESFRKIAARHPVFELTEIT